MSAENECCQAALSSLASGIVSMTILAFSINFVNLQMAVFLQGSGTILVPVRIFAQIQFNTTP